MPKIKNQVSETKSQRSPTIDDVAKLAGVSRFAVSRAYTPGASVAPATREKIERASKALGYQPNLIARSLSTQRSQLVAIAVSRLENSFHAELIEYLSIELAGRGYRVVLMMIDRRADHDPPLSDILQYKVDAVILLSVSLSSQFTVECRAANVPVLLVNRYAEDATVPAVVGDNEAGAAAIADFLLDGGHDRLAFIAGCENASTSRDRERGFTRRIKERGARKPMRAVGNFLADHAAEAARGLLSRKTRPDAIFCANDHMAFAVMDVAQREFGLTVGSEISVVGFDDSLPARWAGGGLTTFAQPTQTMADTAVRQLMTHFSGNSIASQRIVIDGALIVRSSARVPDRLKVTVP